MRNLHFFHPKIATKSPFFQKRQNFKEFLKKQSFENHPQNSEIVFYCSNRESTVEGSRNLTTALIEDNFKRIQRDVSRFTLMRSLL